VGLEARMGWGRELDGLRRLEANYFFHRWVIFYLKSY
jgi:hypothetical protein